MLIHQIISFFPFIIIILKEYGCSFIECQKAKLAIKILVSRTPKPEDLIENVMLWQQHVQRRSQTSLQTEFHVDN